MSFIRFEANNTLSVDQILGDNLLSPKWSVLGPSLYVVYYNHFNRVRSKFSFLRRDVTVTDRSIIVPFPRRFPPTLFLFLNILLHFSASTRPRMLCMKWQRSLDDHLIFFDPKRCGNGKVTVTSRFRSSVCFDVVFDNDLKESTK